MSGGGKSTHLTDCETRKQVFSKLILFMQHLLFQKLASFFLSALYASSHFSPLVAFTLLFPCFPPPFVLLSPYFLHPLLFSPLVDFTLLSPRCHHSSLPLLPSLFSPFISSTLYSSLPLLPSLFSPFVSAILHFL